MPAARPAWVKINITFVNWHNNIAGFSVLWIKRHRQFLEPEDVTKDEVMETV